MQKKNLVKPKFRLYVTTSKRVDVKSAGAFIVKRYGAQHVTTVRGQAVNTMFLSASAGTLSNIWNYFQKKHGVQSVRLGK